MTQQARRTALAFIMALATALPATAEEKTPAVVQAAPSQVDLAPAQEPLLDAELGVIFLKRSGPRRTLLGQRGDLNAGTVDSSLTANFDARWQAAPSLLLGWRLDRNNRFEVSWFGVDEWFSENDLLTTQGGTAGTTTPISPFGFVLQPGAAQGGIQATNRSYLQNVEFGLRRFLVDDDCNTVSWFLGGRYVYFRDALSVTRAGTQDNETYGFAGENNLLGVDGGFDIGRNVGFLTLGVKGRVSIGPNFTTVNGTYKINVTSTPGINPADFRTQGETRTVFSTVTNLGAYGLMHVNQHFGIRLGYDFFYLSALALGPNQQQRSLINASNDPNTGNLTIQPGQLRSNTTGSLFLNGFSTTFEVTW